MKIILSLFFFTLCDYSLSQFDKIVTKGKFIKNPKFDSSCGILVSAEEIGIKNLNDTLKIFIICSEIYKNTIVNLDVDYIIGYYSVDFKDLNQKIIGIKDENIKINILDTFKKIE
jgi:hypothetical protein